MKNEYKTLSIMIKNALATVAIDNGPINLLDAALITDLYNAGQQLAADNTIKVIVFESANPDFFIAHADINMIMGVSDTPQPDDKTPSMLQSLFEMYRHMPKVTIGKIQGVARGGGSEFLLALDMRFGAIGQARLAQPEVALGLIAGGGGCTRLPKLLGRGRSMEILLGCDDFDAELAERYGYINRAIPADEIDTFVNQLAERISTYPAHALASTKVLVNAAEIINDDALGREYGHFYRSATRPGMKDRMAQGLEKGMQTYDVECGEINKVIDQLEPME